MLNDPLFIIVALAVAAVAGILLYGIGGFAAGVIMSSRLMRTTRAAMDSERCSGAVRWRSTVL